MVVKRRWRVKSTEKSKNETLDEFFGFLKYGKISSFNRF